jgi:protoporphyrin/coproporphyrin ferrochelatase
VLTAPRSAGPYIFSMRENEGVLLMAYGTPKRLDDVDEYFTHIRGGRRPPPDAIDNLRQRYVRVGGSTPLLHISADVRDRLEAEVARSKSPRRVFLGMKHWHPFIAETMTEMRDAGIRQFTAIALAPHFSKLSVGAYQHAVEEAQVALGNPFEIRFVDSWHMLPEFTALIAWRVERALSQFAPAGKGDVTVVFTAHSLPVRIREWNDPYEAQLLESSAEVARLAGLSGWKWAWQSAGGSREPWLGPDILAYLDTLHAEGVRRVLQVPIGFVSDHLEILFDIDIEAKEKAASLGMTLHRTELPNASPDFITALSAVVRAS